MSIKTELQRELGRGCGAKLRTDGGICGEGHLLISYCDDCLETFCLEPKEMMRGCGTDITGMNEVRMRWCGMSEGTGIAKVISYCRDCRTDMPDELYERYNDVHHSLGVALVKLGVLIAVIVGVIALAAWAVS